MGCFVPELDASRSWRNGRGGWTKTLPSAGEKTLCEVRCLCAMVGSRVWPRHLTSFSTRFSQPGHNQISRFESSEHFQVEFNGVLMALSRRVALNTP